MYHVSFIIDKSPNTYQGNKAKKLEASAYQELYLVGLLATAITIFFEDDEQLDKKERKIIMKLLKKAPYKLSRETKKFIYWIMKNKMNLYELKVLYSRKDINHKMVLAILDELEPILERSSQNMDNRLILIQKLRTDYLK